ncbi:MAG: GHKL domain-containing protein [Cyclobacteriaceae bacterium]|nr:GHKL domain-containing protein [Cyclobacteriaceae bacterium HetDA_MAG_MS6]
MPFHLQVILRVALILVLGFGAQYFFFSTPFWLVGCWLVLFCGFGIFSLIYLVQKSNRELRNLLVAIRQNDFSQRYPEHQRQTRVLHHAFNVITGEFVRLRSEKESSFHLFQTVVEHSGVPLLAYEIRNEKVVLVNESAKVLFGVPHVTQLRSLERVNPEVLHVVKALASGQKVLLKTELQEEQLYLSVIAKEMMMSDQRIKVVVFHNINSELDQQEIESWQKLIRVLTHEIKNSVIPISTLTEVINQMLTSDTGNSRTLASLDQEEEEDLKIGLRTIEKRSKGLVKFVSSYGDLAKVSSAKLEPVDIVSLTREVLTLQRPFLDRIGITGVYDLPSEEIVLQLDRQMITQVLINLVKNAGEAVAEADNPTLRISIKKLSEEILWTINDNGQGIDQETLEHIFVPFFTTKKEGSGIGLSFSKQVMRAHRGSIKVYSQVGRGTTFTLTF